MDRIERKLDYLIKQEARMDATTAQVLAGVQNETTLETSIITLLNNVEAQLLAALANTNINPADQANLNAIFDNLEANKTALTAAITANTPVTPAP